MQILEIDHFAIACETLAQGVEYVADSLGIRPSVKGAHPKMGTHNRLMSLGSTVYLEVIAIDPEAPPPTHPRWFDLNNFSGNPRLTNWICRTTDLQAALDVGPPNAGKPVLFERDKYRWDIAVPVDGKLPFDGAFPALIQWHGSAHPARDLPQNSSHLIQTTIGHSSFLDLKQSFAGYHLPSTVTLAKNETPKITLSIETPNGERSLS